MRHVLLRTKPLDALLAETREAGHRLKKTLTAWDLVALGIGCIIGVGIFVLPGVEAARHAGPGIVLSFAIAAAACACSALCYAELAAMIPVSGSAYTYGYATLGELPAWIIGWDLILEYMVAACLVSIGWSAYLVNLVDQALKPWALAIPKALSSAPLDFNMQLGRFTATGAWINLPAIAIITALTILLVRGIKESSRVNLVIVIVKLAVILFFILLTVWYVKPSMWHPFMPFGFGGVMTAAAIVFLAYVGFDAVSTAAEEALNPQRDMPIGIIGSLIVATVLYMVVSAIMTGIVPWQQLGVPDPVALVLNTLQMPWASMIVSVGAIAGITSVLLVLLLGQPRILFAMSRDGLLPAFLSRVHPKFMTPYLTTIGTGIVVSIGAALLPIQVVAELCSIGTLFAFIIVCAGVIVLRYTRADLERPFRVPGGWITCASLVVIALVLNVLVDWRSITTSPVADLVSAAAPGEWTVLGAPTAVLRMIVVYVVLIPLTFARNVVLSGWAMLPTLVQSAAIVVVFAAVRRHLLPALGILLCGNLMVSLPITAWERFAGWLGIGLAIYFLYGQRTSRLNAGRA